MSEHSGHRHRLIQKLDSGSLCEHEYLEMLLFNAVPRRNTNDIAHRLLARFGNIRDVLGAPLEQLQQVEGVGESIAAYLRCVGKFCSAFGCSDRGAHKYPDKFEHESFPAYVRQAYAGLPFEKLEVYLIDDTGAVFASRGFTHKEAGRVAVDSDELFALFLLEQPSGIVLVHNHPYGSCEPSKTDDEMTVRFQVFCGVHNILLCDHFIYSPTGIYSYYKSGKLVQMSRELAPKTLAGGVER